MTTSGSGISKINSRLSTVVKDGDTRLSLAALRDYLAECLDACRTYHRRDCACECGAQARPRARDVADLAAKLADVLRQIDSLPAGKSEGSEVDEFTRKWLERRGDAARPTGT